MPKAEFGSQDTQDSFPSLRMCWGSSGCSLRSHLCCCWSSGFTRCLCPSPDWKKGMDVPTDIAIAYLLQCSFYGHSIYATAYMDTWRKDSVVMLLHHVVALTLIAFSYAFR